jgi:formylglycine-generating enzyme
MKSANGLHKSLILSLRALALGVCVTAEAAAPVITRLALMPEPRLTIVSDMSVTNQIQSRTNLGQGSWVGLTNLLVGQSPYQFLDAGAKAARACYYRVVQLAPNNAPPAGMVLIGAGSFTMGNCMTTNEGFADELPLHNVYVSAFYMDTNLVSYTLWQQVYQWATNHGYSFDNVGAGKAPNHPVQTINWYDMVKWCNARSEQEGLVPAYCTAATQTSVYRAGRTNVLNGWVRWTAGYRLPTEAEWEKAARGGTAGHRFPWADGDAISHSRANYYADTNSYAYDVSPTAGYQPAYTTGDVPYTSPVGSFAANAYGLYDMAGNVFEWCWDWYDISWYGNAGATQDNTRGPTGPLSLRVLRSGDWNYKALYIRCSYRYDNGAVTPSYAYYGFGFRCARGL